MIAIIDYGGGNIGSVRNSLEYLKLDCKVTDDPDELDKADKIILPGQGRFGDVMQRLKKTGIDKAVIKASGEDKPFLGICIGLQVLFDAGEEDPGVRGLSIIRGKVPKIKARLKLPQIGWNNISIKRRSRLLDGIADGSYFYFVHSYCCECDEPDSVLAEATYGIRYTCAVERKNMFAVQFHPEKSGIAGLRLLKNFGDLRC